jgi:hypothetical protein
LHFLLFFRLQLYLKPANITQTSDDSADDSAPSHLLTCLVSPVYRSSPVHCAVGHV